MEFGIAFAMGAAACGALWWYVDSRGGVAAVEKSVIGQAKAAENKVADAAKAEISKVV